MSYPLPARPSAAVASTNSGASTPTAGAAGAGDSSSATTNGAAGSGAYDYSAYYASLGYTPVASGSSSAGTSAAAAGPSTSAYPTFDPSGTGYSTSTAGTGYDYGGYGDDQYGINGGYAGAGQFAATDEELAAQSSIYSADNTSARTEYTKKAQKGQARRTVLRKGAGEVWEDATLMEWDPKHFRLFIGDLGNDVNDDDLVAAFGPVKGWNSFVKAKVVRDKVTNKTRGYGFVSYEDPEDFMKAWKAMDGKYVGSRPVKIQKATTQVRQIDIGAKKARELDTKKKAHTVGNKVRGAVQLSGTWKPYIRR